MNEVKTLGMVLTKSAFNGICEDYFLKNLDDINTYSLFLKHSMPEIINILQKKVDICTAKFNLKHESTYIIPETN